MIARIWRGWTKAENADAYEKLLQEVVYPGLQTIAGYRGGYILRQDKQDESEFATVNLFESLDAVKAFAGEDYETPFLSGTIIVVLAIAAIVAAFPTINRIAPCDEKSALRAA